MIRGDGNGVKAFLGLLGASDGQAAPAQCHLVFGKAGFGRRLEGGNGENEVALAGAACPTKTPQNTPRRAVSLKTKTPHLRNRSPEMRG
jgi:hypothetical protein